MAAVYLETDAAVEIGFTAWISPYATIIGVAVTCGEVRPSPHANEATQHSLLRLAKPNFNVSLLLQTLSVTQFKHVCA